LVDVVRFELTKPCGNRVTAGSDTPTSTAHPKYRTHCLRHFSPGQLNVCIKAY